MEAILLVPMLLCTVALFRRTLAQVFLDLYLPILLLFPLYFEYKLPNVPPLNVSEAVLVPLGLALLWKQGRTWRLTTTDLWMGLFVLSSAVMHFQTNDTTIGWFHLFHDIFQALVPYMIGKLLIEQFDLRLATVRRFVGLTVVCCVISMVEYFRGRNPFATLWGRFFPDQPLVWITQFRWGFGRVAGPFGQSELAGMMFLVALVLATWAAIAYPWPDKIGGLAHPGRQRTIIFAVLLVALFTTQARGPWLGCLLAVPVALLGRTRHLLRNGLVLLLLCAAVGSVVYVKGAKYTKVTDIAKTDEQQTAQYRRQLLDAYVPEAQQGGAWGLGDHFPIVAGAGSIDNEYLFLWLTQGWVGLVSFLFVAVETVTRLVLAIARSTGKRDRFFALSLLGAFLGILLTIGTVYLAQQPYQVFFLLAGWAQSVRTVTARNKEERRLAFAHVLT